MTARDEIILCKITKYCDDILRYIDNTDEGDFSGDDKTIVACAFCLGQLGELTKKLGDDAKAAYPNIPWHKIYGLRNRIVHDYEGVNISLLWEIVSDDIPKLKNALRGGVAFRMN